MSPLRGGAQRFHSVAFTAAPLGLASTVAGALRKQCSQANQGPAWMVSWKRAMHQPPQGLLCCRARQLWMPTSNWLWLLASLAVAAPLAPPCSTKLLARHKGYSSHLPSARSPNLQRQGAGAPKRRHPCLPAAPPRAAAALCGCGAAGAHWRQHGHAFVCAGRWAAWEGRRYGCEPLLVPVPPGHHLATHCVQSYELSLAPSAA